MIAMGTLPLVAYAILLRRQLMRPVPLFERLLLIAFVGGIFVVGLASGWLGTGAAVLVVTGCVLLDTRFHIPKLALFLVLAYVLFLQPAKQQFRKSTIGGSRLSLGNWTEPGTGFRRRDGSGKTRCRARIRARCETTFTFRCHV